MATTREQFVQQLMRTPGLTLNATTQSNVAEPSVTSTQRQISNATQAKQALQSGGLSNLFKTGGQTASQTLTGIGKSVAQQAGNILTAPMQIGNWLAKKVMPNAQPSRSLPMQAVQALNQWAQARNPNEQVGKNVGDIAGFLIGGEALAPVKAAATGSKLLNVLPKAAQGTARLAAGSAIEGLGTAGIAKSQGVSDKETANIGLITGGTNAILGTLGALASKIPETAWSKILKQTPTEYTKSPSLAKEGARTGLFGTAESMAQQAQSKIDVLEGQIQTMLKGKTGTINSTAVAKTLDDLKTTYESVPGEQASVRAIIKIQDEIKRDLNKATPEAANAVKRALYKVSNIAKHKPSLELPAKTEAQQKAALAIKNEIERIVPEVKDINKSQGIYIQLRNALDKASSRGSKGLTLSTKDFLFGGGVGFATGNPLLGIGAPIAAHVAETPLVQSGISKMVKYFNDLPTSSKQAFYNSLKAGAFGVEPSRKEGTQTPTTHSLYSGIQTAQSMGADSTEVLAKIVEQYGESSPVSQGITQAISQGFSPEEILQEISRQYSGESSSL